MVWSLAVAAYVTCTHEHCVLAGSCTWCPTCPLQPKSCAQKSIAFWRAKVRVVSVFCLIGCRGGHKTRLSHYAVVFTALFSSRQWDTGKVPIRMQSKSGCMFLPGNRCNSHTSEGALVVLGTFNDVTMGSHKKEGVRGLHGTASAGITASASVAGRTSLAGRWGSNACSLCTASCTHLRPDGGTDAIQQANVLVPCGRPRLWLE